MFLGEKELEWTYNYLAGVINQQSRSRFDKISPLTRERSVWCKIQVIYRCDHNTGDEGDAESRNE